MELIEFMKDMAFGAGRIQKDNYMQIENWRQKSGKGDIVTEVDEKCERYILDRLSKEYPDATILSEESGSVGVPGGKDVWIIDPLDGTRNYAMKIPFFCVSIGLTRNGAAYAGVIYDPIHDELFYAERGKGAFLNGEPIHVSKDESMDDSLLSVSWVKRKVERKRFIDIIDKLAHETSYFRRFGAAALVMSYVACGRLSAYIQGGLSPWDIAAGIVIIEEAGGKITDFDSRQINLSMKNIEVVTANSAIHSILINDVIHGKG